MSPSPRALSFLLAAVLLASCFTAVRIPRHGFVTVDLGALWLQVHGLAATGVPELPVGPLLAPVARDHWPWRLSDTPPGPIDDWQTVSGWSVPVNGRWLIIYPIGFAWLCAWLSHLVGAWGPLLLPLASGAVAAGATAILAARLGVRRPLWPAAVVGVGSPLALYSVLVWGHAPAVAACAVGFALLTRRQGEVSAPAWRTLAAGAAFGAAAAFRNEGLLMAAVVGALVWVCGPRPAWRHGPAFAVGLALVMAGPLAYNRTTFGTWLDATQAARARYAVTAAPGGAAELLSARLQTRAVRAVHTVWECLLRSDNLAAPAQAAVGGALVLALVMLATGGAAPARAALLVVVGASGLYLVFAQVVRPQQVPGLLLCCPAVLPGVAALLAPRAWWGDMRLHGLAVVLFLLGCAQRGSPGWQWGARYMLLALPVLAVLAARLMEGLEERFPAVRVHLVALWLIGCGMTLVSWRDLVSEQAFREEEQAVVRSTDARVVAFDHWWFSWENAPLALDHELMFVPDAAGLAGLLTRVPEPAVLLVTRGDASALSGYGAAAATRGYVVSARWDAVLPFGHEWHALELRKRRG